MLKCPLNVPSEFPLRQILYLQTVVPTNKDHPFCQTGGLIRQVYYDWKKIGDISKWSYNQGYFLYSNRSLNISNLSGQWVSNSVILLPNSIGKLHRIPEALTTLEVLWFPIKLIKIGL